MQCHSCFQCGTKLDPGAHILVDEENKSVACALHFINDDSIDQGKILKKAIWFLFLCLDSIPSTSMSTKESRALPPIPQYPFEMYTYGELYTDNGKFMKRRGPRTTIKQNQVC